MRDITERKRVEVALKEADRRRSEEAGFDHHLTKPADPGTLEHLLAEASHSLRSSAACGLAH